MKRTLIFSTVMLASSLTLAQDPKLDTGIAQVELPASKNQEIAGELKGAIKKAKVFFIEPKDGATVGKKFKIKMGVEGMSIKSAGVAVDDMTSGHHHVLVNKGSIPAGQPIPADEHHVHFGKGQTEAEMTLPSGDHTLTLQFADGAHRSFGPALSQTIKVHVK